MIDLGLGHITDEIRGPQLEAPSLAIETAKSIRAVERMITGRFKCWMTRPKSGSMIGKPWWIKNGATTVGLNYMLNTGFRATSQLTTWYCGIIAATSYSGVSVNDTMSSHSGWTELTGYSESVRQTWSPGAAASGALSNSTAMAFTINATTTAQGIFIASDSTKSGTSGTLWCTAVEGSAFSVTSGVVFNAIYEAAFTPIS